MIEAFRLGALGRCGTLWDGVDLSFPQALSLVAWTAWLAVAAGQDPALDQ